MREMSNVDKQVLKIVQDAFQEDTQEGETLRRVVIHAAANYIKKFLTDKEIIEVFSR